ncbi:hypothetical protein [Confluentibacter flavum]|uniref:hypothetical protein n=1 Tax=Confluentibacter flavum TaxID=1909700 RepID=UPI0012FECAA5|nr:hypothetical protein [Confluentibacter flavum]
MLKNKTIENFKQKRANELMEIQSQISWKWIEAKIEQALKAVIKRKKAGRNIW